MSWVTLPKCIYKIGIERKIKDFPYGSLDEAYLGVIIWRLQKTPACHFKKKTKQVNLEILFPLYSSSSDSKIYFLIREKKIPFTSFVFYFISLPSPT